MGEKDKSMRVLLDGTVWGITGTPICTRREAWERVVEFCCEAEQLTQKIHILGFRHKDVVEALYEAAAHAAAWGRIAVERSL